MMKSILLIMSSLVLSTGILKGQQHSRGHLLHDSISPVNATINDSIELHIEIAFPDLGNAKLGSKLTMSSDTIRYSGCYACGGMLTQPSVLWDTVKLGLFSVGTYHVIMIASYPDSFQDSCFIYQPGFNDTLYTSFTVSDANSMQNVDAIKFSAILERSNLLRIQSVQEGTLEVNIYNVLGKKIYENNAIDVGQGNNSIQIELPSQASGLYFYELIMNEQRKVLRFVKE